MRKKSGIINAVLLSLVMVMTPAANALAANSYTAGDAAADIMNGEQAQYLLPGDSITNYNSLYINAADDSSIYSEDSADPASSSWTNDPDGGTVYSVSVEQSVLEDGVTTSNNVTLKAAGYEVILYDGTFVEPSDTVFTVEGDEENAVHAWFPVGIEFKICPNESQDGQQFTGWTVDEEDPEQPKAEFGETSEDGTTTVTLSSAVTGTVTIRASYAQAETAAETTAETAAETTAETTAETASADDGSIQITDPNAEQDVQVVPDGSADVSADSFTAADPAQSEASEADTSAEQSADGTQYTLEDQQNVDIMGYSDGTQTTETEVQESETETAYYTVNVLQNEAGITPVTAYYDSSWYPVQAADVNGLSAVPAGTYVTVQLQAVPDGYTFVGYTVTDSNGAVVRYDYTDTGDASSIYFAMPESDVTIQADYSEDVQEAETETETSQPETAQTETETETSQPETAQTESETETSTEAAQQSKASIEMAAETNSETSAETEVVEVVADAVVDSLQASADNGTSVVLDAESGFPAGSDASLAQIDGSDLETTVQKIADAGEDVDSSTASAVAYDISVTDQNNEKVEPSEAVQTSITFGSDEEYESAKNSKLYHVKDDGIVEEISFQFDDASRTITFETSSFSPFVFVHNVQTYTVTTDGNVTSDQAADVAAGTAVTVSTPSQADHTASWTVKNTTDNTSVDITSTEDDGTTAKATFTMPEASVNVYVDFTENSHNITAGDGVTVSASTATAGTSVTATFSAKEGSTISWTITDAGGNAIAPDSTSDDGTTVTFTMPSADVSVSASYTPNTHKVTINGNGTVKVDGASQDAVPYGVTVTITASVGSGSLFKGWTVDKGSVQLADASKAETTFTMPDEDVVLSFSYDDPSDISTDSYTHIASGADDSNKAVEGTTITITADTRRGYQLNGISVKDESGSAVSVTDQGSGSYSFAMPAGSVTVTADYEALPSYSVTVTSGKASNDYSDNKFYAGDTVTVTASTPETGYRFKEWKVTSGNVTLADTSASTTTFTMPSANVQLEAVYEKITYTLTVNNGDGDGEYTAGTKVTLTADWPAEGKEFSSWEVTSGTATVNSSDRFTASLTMPAEDITVEAVYKNGPSIDNCYIDGISQNEEFLKNSTITFTAVGDGMDNTNPNPGDYRYRPTGYAISDVSKNYSNSSYKTSMAISTVGQYTLTVYFTRDVYQDGSWVADGSSVSRSVTFNVVESLSVETGDTNPILPMILIGAAALAVIIILIAVKARRRKRG